MIHRIKRNSLHPSYYNVILLLLIMTCAGTAQTLATGRISGRLIDAENGEPLIGVNAYLENTTIGAATDLDGIFSIYKIPVGEYTLVINSVGYQETRIVRVKVGADELVKIDLAIKPEILTTESIVVEARAIQNTDAALLRQRQKSNSISDAISEETISRSGSGDAASAMNRVTGASVVGGKYVYIRGLGERYSSTQLNGAELPSADPDKKAFNMDIMPSNMLENIVTKKTFTPDEPGNFSGGIVNFGTKSFPDNFTLKFSSSIGYNSQTTYNKNYITYDGGSQDWLGMDDGTRSLPVELKDPGLKIPSYNASRSNMQNALFLDDLSKSFSTIMYPVSGEAPVNQSYSLGIGNQNLLFGKPLGYFVSFSYSNNYSFYENGTVGRWLLAGPSETAANLNTDLLLEDTKSVNEVLWGGLATLSYKPWLNHELSFNVIYTKNGESTTRYQTGIWPNQLDPGTFYETRSLLFTERDLSSYQFKGQHHLNMLSTIDIDWNVTLSDTRQDEPDLRFFSNDYSILYDQGMAVDTVYDIHKNNYNVPTRFFRSLDENKQLANLNLIFPFKQWGGMSAKFKMGGSYIFTRREFRERRFEFHQSPDIFYDGDTEEFFNTVGITDSSNARRIKFGNYVMDFSTPRSNYDGDETITAGYMMVELPLYSRLKVIAGARYETTDLSVISQDSTEEKGKLNNTDWLPSVGFNFELMENMNIRLAYGKTLARPNMREKASFRSFEFLGDYLFVGNTQLQRTLIHNLDLRWEWFSRPGEIYAVSLFYKNFRNPIERVFNPTIESYTVMNVPLGEVYGAEFEVRKNLDVITGVLKNFSLSANLTLIHSNVNISSEEYKRGKEYDENFSRHRPLFGQSPYLFNTELAYVNGQSGTTLSLLINQFGKRLAEVVYGHAPDIYEKSRLLLDFTASQDVLFPGLSFKLGVKNILDARNEQIQEFKEKEYMYYSYKTGRTVSVGLSYTY